MAKQKTVTVGEHQYTLQHPGVPWYVECLDRCKDRNGNLQASKYWPELLENVVVDPPNLKLEDFNDCPGDTPKLMGEVEFFLNS